MGKLKSGRSWHAVTVIPDPAIFCIGGGDVGVEENEANQQLNTIMKTGLDKIKETGDSMKEGGADQLLGIIKGGWCCVRHAQARV